VPAGSQSMKQVMTALLATACLAGCSDGGSSKTAAGGKGDADNGGGPIAGAGATVGSTWNRHEVR